MPKFRRNPLTVTAEQFWPDKVPWPAGVRRGYVTNSPYGRDDGHGDGYRIDTPVHDMRVVAGDWIVTGMGERFAISDASLRANYTLIDEIETPPPAVESWWAGPDDEAVA